MDFLVGTLPRQTEDDAGVKSTAGCVDAPESEMDGGIRGEELSAGGETTENRESTCHSSSSLRYIVVHCNSPLYMSRLIVQPTCPSGYTCSRIHTFA